MKIKTIDINAKEWFDKVNGNSYFSCEIVINYRLKDQVTLKLPFQYGYGEQYEYEALKKIKEELKIKSDIASMWRFCDENKIVLRSNKQENCLKKDLK